MLIYIHFFETQVCKPAQPPPKAPSRRLLPFNIPKKSQKPVKTAETSCQCPEDDIIKFDAPSQYDRYRLDTHCDCACPTVKPVIRYSFLLVYLKPL